jgi:leader peptidase (prepilin peptidase)/N-methyltransferase
MAEALLAGLFGLLIGSFLNVCIHRWPRELSVVRPRSRCPNCEAPIAWYDNIPILSWIVLRGHCRRCHAPIHWRYPVVELLTALTFVWFVLPLGLSLAALKFCIFSAILIALAFTDLETRLLPVPFLEGGLAIGLLLSFFVPVPDTIFHLLAGLFGKHPGPRLGSFGEAMLGAFLPAGTLWAAGWLFQKLRHKEGLGFGDVEMLAMVGAFLGLRGALVTVILGSLLGSVVGLTYIKLTGKDPGSYQLPFASFLSLGAFVTAIEGQRLLSWYAHNVL